VTRAGIIISIDKSSSIAVSFQSSSDRSVVFETFGTSPTTTPKQQENDKGSCSQTNNNKDPGDRAFVVKELRRVILSTIVTKRRRVRVCDYLSYGHLQTIRQGGGGGGSDLWWGRGNRLTFTICCRNIDSRLESGNYGIWLFGSG
jgi:hypothetical protein